MTTARCERQGQTEIGIISYDGHDFAALGATVHGRHLTAYTKLDRGHVVLTTWCGKTMLACRHEVVREFRDGTLALVFRLIHGRFVAGYALADIGMLFRGELLADTTADDAERAARRIADHFATLDAEEEADFDPDA